MNNKNSFKSTDRLGKWRRAHSLPGKSGDINVGELGGHIYLWYKKNLDEEGPGFAKITVAGPYDKIYRDKSLVQLGSNLNDGLQDHHSIYLFGQFAKDGKNL